MNPVVITTKFTRNQFIRANFILTYRIPIILIATAVGLFTMLLSLIDIAQYGYSNAFSQLIGLVLGAYVILVLPFMVYLRATKNFRPDARVTETIVYTFEDEMLRIHGDTFDASLTWSKLHDVRFLKDFIFIYQTKRSANIITTNHLSPEQLEEAKAFLLEKKKIMRKK